MGSPTRLLEVLAELHIRKQLAKNGNTVVAIEEDAGSVIRRALGHLLTLPVVYQPFDREARIYTRLQQETVDLTDARVGAQLGVSVAQPAPNLHKLMFVFDDVLFTSWDNATPASSCSSKEGSGSEGHLNRSGKSVGNIERKTRSQLAKRTATAEDLSNDNRDQEVVASDVPVITVATPAPNIIRGAGSRNTSKVEKVREFF